MGYICHRTFYAYFVDKRTKLWESPQSAFHEMRDAGQCVFRHKKRELFHNFFFIFTLFFFQTTFIVVTNLLFSIFSCPLLRAHFEYYSCKL